MKSFDVIGIGALNADLIFKVSDLRSHSETSVNSPVITPGGSAANSLCALSKLGIKTAAVGRTGRDSYGKLLLDSFRKSAVEYTQVSRGEEHSGISNVFVDPAGKRMIYTIPGVNSTLETKHINTRFLLQGKWIHFSNFIDEKQEDMLLQIARKINRSVHMSLWLDANVLPFGYKRIQKILPYIHTVFTKDSVIEHLLQVNAKEGIRRMKMDGCEEVAVIHSPYRSSTEVNGTYHEINTEKTSVIDATGVSCAYVAGYLYGKIKGFPQKQSAAFGNVMMSFCAEKIGCRTNYPSVQEMVQRSLIFKEDKNILIVGGGGREHALAWAFHKSPHARRVYVAPGNAGTHEIAHPVPIKETDTDALKIFVKDHNIDLTVVGPELPLSQGIVDEFEKEGLPIIGPSKEAAKLETSKVFAKKLMQKFNIPTGKYKSFISYNKALSYIKKSKYPLVLKADGLAAGKGVAVCNDFVQAKNFLTKLMKEKAFGRAGETVIVEECLVGEEASVLAFTDGEHIIPMLPAQDHKAVFDNDKGPNTGGMGAYAPAPVITPELLRQVLEKILKPTVTGMKKLGMPYKGILYAGIMVTKDGPRVLEYNCRFGDPETQVLLPLLKTDLLTIMEAIFLGQLKHTNVEWHDGYCTCVVLASKGYPASYETGKEVSIKHRQGNGVYTFHSGTQTKTVTSGGRVLAVYAVGKTLEESINRSYEGVSQIHFDNVHHRKDIGAKALKRQRRTH